MYPSSRNTKVIKGHKCSEDGNLSPSDWQSACDLSHTQVLVDGSAYVNVLTDWSWQVTSGNRGQLITLVFEILHGFIE